MSRIYDIPHRCGVGKGKVHGLLLSFHTVDFILALHTAAKNVKILYENLVAKFQTIVEKMKVIL